MARYLLNLLGSVEGAVGRVGWVEVIDVLIVAVILYFGFSKNRMMHRTIRMMVEKGQEVPAALLAPPPPH